MMKSSSLQSAKKFLRIFIIVEAGSFAGRALRIYTRYQKHPEYYILTDPWYIDVLHLGIVTGVVIAIIAIIYYFISRKIRKLELEK